MHRSAHLEERVQWRPWPAPRSLPRRSPRRRRLRSDRAGRVGRAGREAFSRVARPPGRMMDALDERLRTTRGRWMAEVLHDVAAGDVFGLPRARPSSPRRRASAWTHAGPPPGSRSHRVPRHLPRRGVPRRPGRRSPSTATSTTPRSWRASSTWTGTCSRPSAGKDSVRVGWGQVWDRPCWTAHCVASLLIARGWDGRPQPAARPLARWVRRRPGGHNPPHKHRGTSSSTGAKPSRPRTPWLARVGRCDARALTRRGVTSQTATTDGATGPHGEARRVVPEGADQPPHPPPTTQALREHCGRP